MFKESGAFSTFAVSDAEEARKFYGETLGLSVTDAEMPGLLRVQIPGGTEVVVYPKPDHTPATFTVLNFLVDDIDSAVDELAGKGVAFAHYDDGPGKTDDKGIAGGGPEGGPRIAWFRDPSGNILSVIEGM